jgi:methylmalonyl-CoA mutase N-terminal domain/subunit
MESMTDEVEAAVRELMGKIEDMGGSVAAIERGFQKSEIEQSAYSVAQSIDSGERTVVGVNSFTIPAEEAYEPLRVDPTIEEQQAERLARLRKERSDDDVRRALDDLRKAAQTSGEDANTLYPMREALRARATGGEVCNALREVWGVYHPTDAL